MNIKVSLQEVDECVSKKGWRTGFPARIERLYKDHSRELRQRGFDKLIWPFLIVYNAYLFVDAFLLPSTWKISAFLHFAIVSPAILFLWRLYPRLKSDRWRETVEASLPLMVIAQIMFIFTLNEGEGAGQYQYFAIGMLFFVNVNMRPRKGVALATTVAICAEFLVAQLLGDTSIAAKVSGSTVMLSAAYATLMANRRLEQDGRHAFLRRLQDKLRFQSAEAEAMNDPLTGTKNRRYLDEFKGHVLPNLLHGDGSLAVLMLDIDHFKNYNDHFGHQAGDQCLREIAGAVAASIRSSHDFVVRYGGEEFLILMLGADIAAAQRTAERIRVAIEAISLKHAPSTGAEFVTVSIGVAAGSPTPETFELLIAQADAALYQAKAQGRNQSCSAPTPARAEDRSSNVA